VRDFSSSTVYPLLHFLDKANGLLYDEQTACSGEQVYLIALFSSAGKGQMPPGPTDNSP
jgi:hypothetical protein